MKKVFVRINSNAYNIEVRKDPSWSERWPWVVRVNGKVVNNGLDQEDAIALAYNWLKVSETKRINDELERQFFKGIM